VEPSFKRVTLGMICLKVKYSIATLGVCVSPP
jgi:hypothetical protein